MADTPSSNRARLRKRSNKKARRTEGQKFPPYRIKKPIGQIHRGPSVPKARDKRPPGEPSPGTPAKEDRSAGDQRDPVVFFTYEPSTDNTGPVSDTAADCSGADSEPGVVIRTGNWFVDLSVDNGGTWKRFDPTTIFPNDLGSGFCCDQIVLFVPRTNIFIWFLQHGKRTSGSGAFRIAVAKPAAIKSNFTTAWTYWDFIADDFGIAGDDLDYPDLAASTTFLYFSTDQMKSGGGRLIGRIPLKELAAGGTINFEYTDPSLSQRPYGSHLAQNSSDGAFWVGHVNNATLQVFSLPDSGNTYSWANVAIGKWPQSTLSSTSPSSVDWMTKLNDFPRYAVIGATRAGNILWLAWSASKGKGDSNTFDFPNAHVRVAQVDVTTMQSVGEMQIWNPDYAFAYPALNTNAQGEVGIALAWGGKNDHANAAVGILGDFVVWFRNGSEVTTKRWGDYVTCRRAARKASHYAGFAYYIKKDTSRASGYYFDPYYVVFGRQSTGP
jgi:hypothetical protein